MQNVKFRFFKLKIYLYGNLEVILIAKQVNLDFRIAFLLS